MPGLPARQDDLPGCSLSQILNVGISAIPDLTRSGGRNKYEDRVTSKQWAAQSECIPVSCLLTKLRVLILVPILPSNYLCHIFLRGGETWSVEYG